MKKILLVSFLLFSSLALLPAQKDTAGVEKHFIEGTVKNRFGVFVVISIDNWEDIEEFPARPQPGYIWMQGKNGWQQIVKAEVYKMDKDGEDIEIKLLEDFGSKANSLGLGQLKLATGSPARFQWEYKTEE